MSRHAGRMGTLTFRVNVIVYNDKSRKTSLESILILPYVQIEINIG